jgi:hypothetical protein
LPVPTSRRSDPAGLAAALKGGIADWLAASLPTETKDAPKQATPEPGALKG